MNTPTKLLNLYLYDLAFDNGGGVTLMTSTGYTFWYESDQVEQLAADVKEYRQTGDTLDWDGHSPKAYVEYDPNQCGYDWFNERDIDMILTKGSVESNGKTHNKFFELLGVLVWYVLDE